MDQAARVVRGDDGAPRPGDGVQLPGGKPARDPRPLNAESAAETAAVGDVRDLDHLVACQLEEPARTGLEAELPQRLARVVIGDLGAGAACPNELGALVQKVEREAGRV